ncbi:hypothetical protein DsansV1_C06g0067421 [Dioscorea sansibarensis]
MDNPFVCAFLSFVYHFTNLTLCWKPLCPHFNQQLLVRQSSHPKFHILTVLHNNLTSSHALTVRIISFLIFSFNKIKTYSFRSPKNLFME